MANQIMANPIADHRAHLQPPPASAAVAVTEFPPVFRALEPFPVRRGFAAGIGDREESRQDPFRIFRRRILLPLLPRP